MFLNKRQTYIYLQVLFIACLLLIQSTWIFSRTTNGEIISFDRAARTGKWKHIETMTVRYTVGYKQYTSVYTRNSTPLWQKQISVRYLTLFPGTSRIDSFITNWEEYMIWYLIFFLATSMIFFVPNEVLPKGTLFELRKQFPWVCIISGTEQRISQVCQNSGSITEPAKL
jgi:hypothetical protein